MPTTQGPRQQRPIIFGSGRGVITVVQGTFRFWLSKDERAAPFVAPIEFEVNRPKTSPHLLGLRGIINQLRWTIGPWRPPREGLLDSCLLQDVRRGVERYPFRPTEA
jgi:hypothetical protein